MSEPAETKAYLKIAAHALQEAWSCDHNAHLGPEADGDTECFGAYIEMGLNLVRAGLKRLAREKEANRRG